MIALRTRAWPTIIRKAVEVGRYFRSIVEESRGATGKSLVRVRKVQKYVDERVLWRVWRRTNLVLTEAREIVVLWLKVLIS